MSPFTLLVLILTGLYALATLLPLWYSNQAWWVRIFDFPRVQLAIFGGVLGIVTVFGEGFTTELTLLCLCVQLACVGFHVFRIFPYLNIAPVEVKAGDNRGQNSSEISLCVGNVLMQNRDTEKLFQLVKHKQPDVLMLTETDQWWSSQLQTFTQDYPHFYTFPLENTYGMTLMSKLPIADFDIKFLVKEDVPSFHFRINLIAGEYMTCILMHPRPPVPQEAETSIQRDAELMQIAQQVLVTQEPVVVAGDLNDVAWSHTTRLFLRTSRLLDPRRGRGLYPTFDANKPWLRFPLDHVFHSEHFRLLAMERLPHIGSDHFPIYVKLQLARKDPIPEIASVEDVIEAQEKIKEAK
ncbi:MAG: endonuclease/exonuclease/phosphatase family protein [Bacteroidota bacterium]